MYRAIYCGASINPCTRAHQRIVHRLAKECVKLFVAVCGPRDDKKESSRLLSVPDRAAVAMLGFDKPLPANVDLSFADFSRFRKKTRTSTYKQLCIYRDMFGRDKDFDGIWLAVGADLIKGGFVGSQICNSWIDGVKIWCEFSFLVLRRPGYEIDADDLPSIAKVLEMEAMSESSTAAREAAARGDRKALLKQVNKQLADYILSRGLYRAS